MDTLLGKLDEFEQLMVLSQSDANVCLFKHVPGLQTKFTEMQSVFDKIDRYALIFISYLMYNLWALHDIVLQNHIFMEMFLHDNHGMFCGVEE